MGGVQISSPLKFQTCAGRVRRPQQKVQIIEIILGIFLVSVSWVNFHYFLNVSIKA